MVESLDLARIRREAFLRALHRAAQNPSVTVVTAASLAQELSLHVAQLGFVTQPLVSDGLITVQGVSDSGAVAFTEKGMSEANEIINRHSPSRIRTKLLCIDTECQGRSKTRPLRRSKNRPEDW